MRGGLGRNRAGRAGCGRACGTDGAGAEGDAPSGSSPVRASRGAGTLLLSPGARQALTSPQGNSGRGPSVADSHDGEPRHPLGRNHDMKIGIIGAGNIGGNLTRRLTALGHEVAVANSRGPQTLAALAEETGATPVTVTEAARGARIVVVTIPLKAIPDLPSTGLFDGAEEGFAVLDTGNYYPRERDGRIAAIEDEGLTESRWTERHLGHPVVKAFNGTYAQDILDRHRPAGDPERIALPVAGDDEQAKKAVRELIDELGFDTVDAGGIDDSWRQQPDTPVYGLRGGVEEVERALAEASPERPESFRG
ncbi:NADPH-dependent F420 reductase [Streptomyces showdoensis]|uniref:NADPH-dependent F420 reductase n=1 Tax=Streptomyces showdoensis TaxID=68268 RepID=UPI0023E472A2|nr:NAD(P)-binding domain-containing protein [Streptomyces showdoensis]